MKFGSHDITVARVKDPQYTQYLIDFPNGYGASIITFSNGTHWEIAVLKFTANGLWGIDYTTPVTDDVIRDLSDIEVGRVLDQIQALPMILEGEIIDRKEVGA